MLVLGPTRSGKTSALLVPNVLLARSSVVTTSTKDDVARSTAHRARDGHVLWFDPSGTITSPPWARAVGWSPVRASASWDEAVHMADAMVAASRLRARGARGADHWSERAGALLAPLLHAAGLKGLGIDEVARWVDLRDGRAALAILVAGDGDRHQAPASLSGLLATDERELSGIWSTTAGVLGAWRTDAARHAASLPPIDVDRFLAGPNTLHIVAPSRHQVGAAPVVAGLLDAIVHRAYERHAHRASLLLALDELANVAPLPSLPSIVSEGAGQGVVVIGCLQDLSQARVRWGTAAEGFLSLFPTTVVLPGIADRATLDALSHLAGTHDVVTTSVSAGGARRATRSRSLVRRPRLPPDAVARGTAGHAIVLDAAKRIGYVALTPAHLDARFAVGGSDELARVPRDRPAGPSGPADSGELDVEACERESGPG